nr:NADH dehydrogenase subunit 4L [Sagra femorata]
MKIYFWISVLSFFSGLISFIFKQSHLLLVLLSLEFMVISIYFMIYIFFNFIYIDCFFSMLYLTLMVCEGVLGLSILVSMMRSHGKDYLISFSYLW